jgi:type IV secretion system protein VirB1
MFDFPYLTQQCAPEIHQDTMRRIVQVESAFNPWAIGVVGGRLERQPNNRDEAIATAEWLERNGFNYSVGYAQVNKTNFAKYGLTLQTAFEACPNLHAGGEILKDCFIRANKTRGDEQAALRDAFSCYYSGNFITGYKQGYVLKVVTSGAAMPQGGPSVPSRKKHNVMIGSPKTTVTPEYTAAAVSTSSALLF